MSQSDNEIYTVVARMQKLRNSVSLMERMRSLEQQPLPDPPQADMRELLGNNVDVTSSSQVREQPQAYRRELPGGHVDGTRSSRQREHPQVYRREPFWRTCR